MKRSKLIPVLTAVSVCLLVACEKKASTAPDSAGAAVSSTDARTGVTQASPQAVTPGENAEIANARQPIRLTVTNGFTASTSQNPTYVFEVATDGGFSSIVQTKADIAPGSGQTSVTLDRLTPDKLYYWRARRVVAGYDGPNSKVRAFRVGPEIVLQAPAAVAPADGATTGSTVSMAVGNVQRSGPAGLLTYLFEVSTSPSFDPLFFSGTVPEGEGQTSTTSPRLTTNVTYFWRARANDPLNEVSSEFSAVRTFRAQPFDPTQARFHDNPPDLGSWPETSKITKIEFTPSAMIVDFDRREGPNRWPDVTPPGWSGSLQYTLGMCMNIAGQWHCSAVVQFWHGRALEDSGIPANMYFEWFYDAGRWKDLQYKRPQEGETVAIFVVSGDARQGTSFTRATCPRVCERTDFVLVPWTRFGGVTYP